MINSYIEFYIYNLKIKCQNILKPKFIIPIIKEKYQPK